MPDRQENGTRIAQLDDVWVKYDGTTVLEAVNFSIEEQDFIGIIGPNGGGKTTLLKVMLGLVKPTQGSVRVLGKPPTKTRQYLGYVPQYAEYDREFPASVGEVVLMGRLSKRKLFRPYTREDREAAAEALERVEMEEARDRQMAELSGGQQQRVLIARALASRPELLLLDEPTASVDRKIETGIYELLQELNQQIAIVMVSHDMSAISTYVKQIACVNRTLYHHHSGEITVDVLEAAYQCPVEMIAHGIPHRVLQTHPSEEHAHDQSA